MDARVGPEESRAPKNWCFELWCWRRLLTVPWTARRSNQLILKISPGISLEGMMLKLKLQYLGHFMWRVDSLEKTLMLGGIRGRRKRGWQKMRCLHGITDSMDVSLSELRELVVDREAWCAVIHRAKSQTWLSDSTEMMDTCKSDTALLVSFEVLVFLKLAVFICLLTIHVSFLNSIFIFFTTFSLSWDFAKHFSLLLYKLLL